MMRIFWPLLAVLLIALKLTNQIDWSWWLVLSPIWAPVVIALVLAAAKRAADKALRSLETPAERAARLMREMSAQISKRS